eukprot:CAMPEP_0119516460 /NCGR_PEP_ID=MMETSP1344-20130328/33652_1 /TAXON_ID=236787 /ORGANISM="Florenciella parvula, Strain CCMP2471" /LENGTH=71 /DNA_ID=CAMNT_0007553961 /DNA_START=68 /DNA_END=286 /DNA_ORIENTATION=-
MVFYTLLRRVPGGEAVQVAVGTAAVLGIASLPIVVNSYNKNERGHEFFSAEKPEAVEKDMKAREDASFSKR